MITMRREGLTYQQIADKFLISRQRVQQCVSPPRSTREIIELKYGDKCNDCGIQLRGSGHLHHEGNTDEDYNDVGNLILLCVSCHLRVHRAANKESHLLHLQCPQCHKPFTRWKGESKRKIVRNKNGALYCSRQCSQSHRKFEVDSHGRFVKGISHPKNLPKV